MRFFKSVITIITSLFFTFSCTDHDIQEPATCKYSGMNYHSERQLNGTSYRRYFDSKYTYNTKGMPDNLTIVRHYVDSSSIKNHDNVNHSYQHDYSYKYNTEGFLIQIVHTLSETYVAPNGMKYRGEDLVKNILIKEVETTDFQYDENFAQTATIKFTQTYIADTNSPQIITEERKKVYKYDQNNVPISIVDTYSTGLIINTYFKNGVISSKIYNYANGATGSESFDDKGRVISSNNPSAQAVNEYDLNGNLVKQNFNFVGNIMNLATYIFDNTSDPKTLLPVTFKGIPENFYTMYGLDGNDNANNIVYRAHSFGNTDEVSTEERTEYTYNSKGYPETAKTTIIENNSPPYIKYTNYKYQDCQ